MDIECSKSLHHLQSYPMIADTYDCVWSYYSWAKEKSSLMNYTCSLAENGIVRVASPLVKTFESQVRAIDEAANSQLSRLDSKFPIVKKPIKELWEDSLTYCDETVRPRVDAVRKPITQRFETVCETLFCSKETSLNYAKQAIEMADHCVDTYLPSDNEEHSEDNEDNELSSFVHEKMDKDCDSLTERSKAVLCKTQRRIRRRGQRSVAEVQHAVQTAVTNVVASMGLLETLQTTRAGMGELNMEFWQRLETLQESRDGDDHCVSDVNELSLSDSSSQNSSDSTTHTVDNRVINLVASYVQSTRQIFTVLSDMVYYRLEEENKDRWDSANHAINDFYLRLTEAPHTLTSAYLHYMRDLFNLVGESVHTSLHYAAEKFQAVKKASHNFTTSEEEHSKTL